MKRTLAVLSVLALVAVAAPSRTRAQADSRGTDFWLAFMQNYNSSTTLTLFIAGANATTGTVAVPGIGFSTSFSVTPGLVTSVAIPATAQVNTNGVVGNSGIHVTAAQEVTVYGLNRIAATTDAFLGLPSDILGTEYLVLGYPVTIGGLATEFALVAAQDNTTVTITPSVTTLGHAAGTPFTVALNQGQTYQLQNTALHADLSGTLVTSDRPIAVYGGNVCTDIPYGDVACDHVVEQLTPTNTWGRRFVTMPLATRLGGDTFRFIASTDATQVTVNGVIVATLGRGQVHERMVSGPALIDASQPILVAQYSNSSSVDGVTSDPFMMIVPPYEQFLAEYTVSTPATGFSANFINVVAPSSAVGSINLDGAAIPAARFSAIGTSGYSGAQLPVALGSHHLDATVPFGVFVYGFDYYDSYGYPGGMSIAPVAVVTRLTLMPGTGNAQIGTQHCVTATVLDQFGAVVPSVRVDFSVSGANSASGFQNASAAGTAQFCYTGQNAGDDAISAAVGTVTAGASMTWGAPSDVTAPSCALTAVVAGPPRQLRITVQDGGSGLRSIVPTIATNATIAVPEFSAGETGALVVTATKIDQTQGAQVALRVTDVAGNFVDCDPIVGAEVETPPAKTGCSQGAGGIASLLGLLALGVRRRRARR